MRTVSSILLLIILVPITLVVFIVWSLKANLVTATFLKHELAARDVYGIVEDQLSKKIATLKLEDLPIATTDIQVLAQQVLPASWLQRSVETILDRSFGWFNGPLGTTLTVPIDLTGPKAAITPALDTLIASAIPKLPECPKQGVPTVGLCRTADTTVATVKDMLKSGGTDLTSVIAQLPDALDLANPVLPSIKLGSDNQATQQDTKQISSTQDDQKKAEEQKDSTSAQPQETLQQRVQNAVATMTTVKEKYHQGLTYWRDVLFAYAILILLYIVINIKGWKRVTRWTGILLLTVGILPLAVSIASKQLVEKLALPKLDLSSLPPEAQTAIPAAIRDVGTALFSSVLIMSVVMVAVGVMAIVGAHWIRVKNMTLAEKVEEKVVPKKRIRKSY